VILFLNDRDREHHIGAFATFAVDDTREDVRELKHRVGSLEREMSQVHVKLAEQSTRIDRLGDRVERIERRLDLTDA
jgi:predicted  nucleic acid-binding Zn-ribbon protein